MRSTVVRTLKELVDEGNDVHFLTADLGFKVLDPFREAYPNRFINVGVSEANMIGVAAGMAMTGLILAGVNPVTAIRTRLPGRVAALLAA